MSVKTVALTSVVSILAFVGVVVAASSAGLLNKEDSNTPLINGTILNNDNKTYSVLIVPSDKNVTVPETPPPVINNTNDNDTIPNPIPIPIPPVNETQPPVVNETQPPVPVPEPTATDVRVSIVGDVDDTTAGKAVFANIKSKNSDVVVGLGDLGYDNTLSWYKSTYGTQKQVCVPGNHEDDAEDGTASLEKETLEYCSNPFYFIKNHVMFVGINSNGDLVKQSTEVTALLKNTKIMQGVKEVHLLTHKPCATPPNAHHPANEDSLAKKVVEFCTVFKNNIPTGIKFVNDAAHNHVLSTSADGMFKTSGGGGHNHYECGVNTVFTFCDNTHYGYLEYIIKADGTTSYHFYDSSGKVLK